MAIWEQVLLGIGGLLLAFFFWPGIMATMEKSRQAEHKDWVGVFIPITVVVIFIIMLIAVARS